MDPFNLIESLSSSPMERTHHLGGPLLAWCGPSQLHVPHLITHRVELCRQVGRRCGKLVIVVVQGGIVLCNDLPALDNQRDTVSEYSATGAQHWALQQEGSEFGSISPCNQPEKQGHAVGGCSLEVAKHRNTPAPSEHLLEGYNCPR